MANRIRIRGACVFRDDGNGCLSSKYVNEHSAPFVETCHLIAGSPQPNPQDPFVGLYNTVWLEENNPVPVSAVLSITRNPNASYDLDWNIPQGLIYSGVGMIYNDLLVCGYWSR
jgi:hypothetical protein